MGATLNVTVDGAPPGGPRVDYLLTPDPAAVPVDDPRPRDLLSSAGVLLNGERLFSDSDLSGAAGAGPAAVDALAFGFFAWPEHGAAACVFS